MYCNFAMRLRGGKMINNIDEQARDKLINNLVENLPVLRAKLNITQEELAEKIGLTRQTLTLVESRKREMSWNMFLSLMMIFYNNKATRPMLDIFEIYTDGLEHLLMFE